VRRYLEGEAAPALAKEYQISRAGMYLWIRKAQEQVTRTALKPGTGPKETARNERISDKLKIKQLTEENELLKRRLFELMSKYKEWG